MTRICTVCANPQRAIIDKAILAGAGYRTIADRFGHSHQALIRHKADHVLPEVLAAWQRERHDNGHELAGILEERMAKVDKLLSACDAWLTDPHDPTKYDLSPRSHEVWVHHEVAVADGRPVRKKERLSALLARIETAGLREPYAIALVEHKSADPRKLILDASKALVEALRLYAEIVGKIPTQGTSATFLLSPEWVALRGTMLEALAPYPEARIALAAALSDRDHDEADMVEAKWR